jgi:SAM-dependent methyltransferase
MEAAEYEKMYTLEDTYWWFQGRLKIITDCLDAHRILAPDMRILDVGCGTGLLLKRLETYRPIGMDFSHLAMGFCQRRQMNKLVQGDVIHLPFATGSINLILALDMLEHVERDDLLVREFHRVLRPGGHTLITVPAHQHLWSEHDEALHHFRRYSAETFRTLLESNGFEMIKFSFAITATYWPIVAFRRFQRWRQRDKENHRPKTHLITLPRIANQLLIQVLRAEAWWLRRHNFRQGVSLLCLARRK